MINIKLKCNGCDKIHTLNRTNEIPDNIKSLSSNWCPNCEDSANDYYEEFWHENEIDENDTTNNQLKLM